MFFDLRNLKNFDWIIAISAIFLFTIGVTVVYSATFGMAGNEKEVLQQLTFGLVGIAAFVFLSFFDYRIFKGISGILYLLTILLLVAVHFFGTTTMGATRWINLGPLQFQPAEFAKLFIIIIMAKYFSDHAEEMHKFKHVIISGIYFAIPVVLVATQPDLGTALVFVVIWASMIVVSRVKIRYVLYLALAFLLVLPIAWTFLHEYQKDRIMTFMEPARDPTGAGYNVNQAVIAIGSGQIFGRGLGHGPQSQLNFIPEKHTDFIFAALAEEMGFVGVAVVVSLFIVLIMRIMVVAAKSRDYFGMYLATGTVAMLSFHTFLNIGMNIGIAPVAGIPLPLISLGGTSVLVNFILLGLVVSVHIRHKKIEF